MTVQLAKSRVRLRVLPAALPLNVEFRQDGPDLQYRYVGTSTWITIGQYGASVEIGAVTTLEPGEAATVVNVGTEQNVVLEIGIPRGADGAPGADGANGGFANKAAAEAYSPVAAPDFIRIEGYATAGDGGGALYAAVESEPSHAGKFSITLIDAVTVVWYEIAEAVLVPQMFGATGDGVTDDTAAVQACFDAAVALNKDIEHVSGDFLVTDTLVLAGKVRLCGRPRRGGSTSGGSILAAAALDVALQLGDDTALFQGVLRDVVVQKAAYSSSPSNNVGIRFYDVADSVFDNVEAARFDIGFDLSPGTGHRVAYCTFLHPYVHRGRIHWNVKPTSTGFVSENTVLGGRCQTTSDGILERHIVLDAQGTGTLNHNRFHDMSLEGGSSMAVGACAIEVVDADWCLFENCRTEGTGWSAEHIVLGAEANKCVVRLLRDDTTVDDNGTSNVIIRRGTYETPLVVPAIFSAAASVADDAVMTVPGLPDGTGIAIINCNGAGDNSPRGMFWINTAGGAIANISMVSTTNVAFATGALTGTTGADGKTTLSVSGGLLYIENRCGATRKYDVLMIGN